MRQQRNHSFRSECREGHRKGWLNQYFGPYSRRSYHNDKYTSGLTVRGEDENNQKEDRKQGEKEKNNYFYQG